MYFNTLVLTRKITELQAVVALSAYCISRKADVYILDFYTLPFLISIITEIFSLGVRGRKAMVTTCRG